MYIYTHTHSEHVILYIYIYIYIYCLCIYFLLFPISLKLLPVFKRGNILDINIMGAVFN